MLELNVDFKMFAKKIELFQGVHSAVSCCLLQLPKSLTENSSIDQLLIKKKKLENSPICCVATKEGQIMQSKTLTGNLTFKSLRPPDLANCTKR